jgi:hypothetical protein
MGPNLCKVLATLNLTFATLSLAMPKMVGNMSFIVISGPTASASNYKRNNL